MHVVMNSTILMFLKNLTLMQSILCKKFNFFNNFFFQKFCSRYTAGLGLQSKRFEVTKLRGIDLV